MRHLTCPVCHSALRPKQFFSPLIEPFECPGCKHWIGPNRTAAERWTKVALGVVPITVSIALILHYGADRWYALLYGLGGWFVAFVLLRASGLFTLLFPPKLELREGESAPYDDAFLTLKLDKQNDLNKLE